VRAETPEKETPETAWRMATLLEKAATPHISSHIMLSVRTFCDALTGTMISPTLQ